VGGIGEGRQPEGGRRRGERESEALGCAGKLWGPDFILALFFFFVKK